MIATMYRRRMRVAFILTTIIFTVGLITFFIDKPTTTDASLHFVSIGIFGFMMISFTISNWNKCNRVACSTLTAL